MSSGGGYMQVTSVSEMGNYLYCHSKVVRDQFPEVFNKRTDEAEPIEDEFNADKGIPEETHFVIARSINHRHPILAIESSIRDPKYLDIQRYFNSMFIHSGGEGEFRFEPLYAFNYDEFKERIRDVAKITMKFHRDDLPEFMNADPSTGELIRRALDFGAAEYVTIEFGINFQKTKSRYPTDQMNNKAEHFADLLKNNPDLKQHIRKLDVKAQDRNNEGRLRLFDSGLISSKFL